MKPFEVLSYFTRQQAVYDKIKTKFSRQFSLSPTSFDIIMFLYNNPQHNTAKEICDLRGIKSGIVSVEVEKLVGQGFIYRENDKLDRRKQRLFLNSQAQEITVKGYELQQKFVKKLNSNLSQDEIDCYHKTLEKIFENINKLEKEGLDFE